MLIRLIAGVAGLLGVLLVIRYTIAVGYTECDRAECGTGWDILLGALRAVVVLLIALVAYGLVRLGWRRLGRRAPGRRAG